MRANWIELIRAETPLWLVCGGVSVLLLLNYPAWSAVPWVIYSLGQLVQMARFLSGRPPWPMGVWPIIWHRWQHHQQRTTDKLKQNYRRIRQLNRMLAVLPQGVVELDEAGNIVWFNPAAESLLGLCEADRGKPVQHLVRVPEFIRWLEQDDTSPLKVVMPQMQLKVLRFQRRPLKGGALLLVEDISREHDLWQVRRDFVANASHELRTPVTVFRGYLETLLSMEALKPWQTPLRHMSEQADRMHLIIEDLLTLSVIEQAQGDGNERTVSLQQLFPMLEEEARQLSRGQHHLHFTVQDDVGLRGEPTLLRSIFANLISNAVRYTPEGGEIRVSWRLNANGEGVFEVKDTGIGIPREHLPRLTERFYRVDKARSREKGGTGLGLAIVKHALEYHQGRLEVESTPRIGSTFRAIFPLQRIVTEVS
ncbi:MAG TPA: phosphate regulon sensor histidine kinase PhoR [Piscirickettsiaceae bacterium]|nr:phosphate regulon sensor histidine kinase PhoR [Piscirickettsiaceae bacterium]